MGMESVFTQSEQIPLKLDTLTCNGKPLLSQPLLELAQRKHLQPFINIYDSGETDRQTIVFIHGNSASMRVFYELVPVFRDRFRIVLVDLPGHGGSFKLDAMQLTQMEQDVLGEAFYSFFGMIAAIQQCLAQKQIFHAHFIGWSLGGHIAYGLAHESAKIATSITSLGSPPVRFSKQGLMTGFRPWFFNTMLPKWINEPQRYPVNDNLIIAKQFGMTNPTAQFFAEDTYAADPAMRKFLFVNIAGYDDNSYAGTSLDGEYFAANTDIPLCLICGSDDSGINAEYIDNFGSRLKNPISCSRLVTNGTHAPFASHPEESSKIMTNFIDEASAL